MIYLIVKAWEKPNNIFFNILNSHSSRSLQVMIHSYDFHAQSMQVRLVGQSWFMPIKEVDFWSRKSTVLFPPENHDCSRCTTPGFLTWSASSIRRCRWASSDSPRKPRTQSGSGTSSCPSLMFPLPLQPTTDRFGRLATALVHAF